MSKKPTISDVAAAAGVHASTVSRALDPEKRSRISDPQIKKILDAAKQLGYTPSSVAMSMRTGRTRNVGFVIHDINDPIYPPILRGLEDALGGHGYMVFVGNSHHDPETEFSLLQRMLSRVVDGVILATTKLIDPALDFLQKNNTPVVSVIRHPEKPVISSVVNDCFEGMRQISQLVFDYGHRDVVFIGGPEGASTSRHRLNGFMSAAESNSISVSSANTTFVSRLGIDQGYEAASNILRRQQRPTALVCNNDMIALGAVKACRDVGLSCPNDVSITGFNGLRLSEFTDPALTTVEVKFREIGFLAGLELLRKMTDDTGECSCKIIAPNLIVRSSLKRIQ